MGGAEACVAATGTACFVEDLLIGVTGVTGIPGDAGVTATAVATPVSTPGLVTASSVTAATASVDLVAVRGLAVVVVVVVAAAVNSAEELIG